MGFDILSIRMTHYTLPEGKHTRIPGPSHFFILCHSTRMTLSLVDRGQNCVAEASKVLPDIAKGRGEEGLVSLEKVAAGLCSPC